MNKKKQGYTKILRTQLKNTLRKQFGLHKNKQTGIEANLSGNSVDKMGSDKAIEKSKNNGFSLDEHFEVANKIVELYENAALVEVSSDKKGSKDLVSIKKFESDVMLGSGKKAVAHITVKESVVNGHKIYSVEVMNLMKKNVRTKADDGPSMLPQPSSGTIPENTKAGNKNLDGKKTGKGNLTKQEIRTVLRNFDGDNNSEIVTQQCEDFAALYPKINKKNFSRYVELLRNTALAPSAKKVSSGEAGVLAFEVSGNDYFIINNDTDVLFKDIPEYDGYETYAGKIRYFFDFSVKKSYPFGGLEPQKLVCRLDSRGRLLFKKSCG